MRLEHVSSPDGELPPESKEIEEVLSGLDREEGDLLEILIEKSVKMVMQRIFEQGRSNKSCRSPRPGGRPWRSTRHFACGSHREVKAGRSFTTDIQSTVVKWMSVSHIPGQDLRKLGCEMSGSRLDPVSNLAITREKGYFDDSGRRLSIREVKT
jgi:hypothetical protein